MLSKKHIVILDSNAIIHRAYHALPPFNMTDGTQVNAVYGYASLLLKVVSELKPDMLIASFDLEGPTFRHKQFAEYKAHREKSDQELYDQIPLVRELVRGLDILELSLKGYEADDVIGTVAEMVRTSGEYQLTIVTGDMDSMQLVDTDISVYRLRKGVNDTVLYDPKAVKEQYGIRPDQVIDYKALQGDASDNIPGVPGIGKKRATDLLTEFESLDGVYAFVESISDFASLSKEDRRGLTKSVFEKLRDNKDQAYLSQDLATIDRHVPIEFGFSDAHPFVFFRDQVQDIFTRFEFFSLLKRLPKKDQAQDSEVTTNQSSFLSTVKVASQPQKKVVDDISLLNFPLVMYPREGAWILMDEVSEYSCALEDIYTILEDENIQAIAYEIKPVYREMVAMNREPRAVVDDVSLMSYLVQPGERSYDIESLALSRSIAFDTQRPEQSLLDLYYALVTELSEKQLNTVYETIERPLIVVLARMEQWGVFLNAEELATIGTNVRDQIETLSKEVLDLAGQEFNMNSPKQLSEILFDTLQIPTKGLKKTASGHISTSAGVLEDLAGDYPIIQKILDYREVAKLESTYIRALPVLRDDHGRIHTTYQQTVAATGRLSSIDPNLQNIPARTELGRKIKACFQAESGWKLLACDYSQIELRLAAHLSGDVHMKQIFLDGVDFHAATAARVYHIPLEDVTKAQRSFAKTINFGILYGMGAHALSRNLQASYAEAKEMLEKYKQAYPELHTYIEDQKKRAHQQGYARTDLGRMRDLSSFNTKNFQQRALMERIAVNMPIQGLQADIIKKAMIEVDHHIQKNPDIRMLLQVHDELVFEVQADTVSIYQKAITEIMERQYASTVPLLVESSISTQWGA